MVTLQLEKHSAGCYAVQAVVEGIWEHPWVLPKYGWLRRDRAGRKHKTANTEYLIFRCNDPSCKSRLAILMDDLEKALGPDVFLVGEQEG